MADVCYLERRFFSFVCTAKSRVSGSRSLESCKSLGSNAGDAIPLPGSQGGFSWGPLDGCGRIRSFAQPSPCLPTFGCDAGDAIPLPGFARRFPLGPHEVREHPILYSRHPVCLRLERCRGCDSRVRVRKAAAGGTPGSAWAPVLYSCNTVCLRIARTECNLRLLERAVHILQSWLAKVCNDSSAP